MRSEAAQMMPQADLQSLTALVIEKLLLACAISMLVVLFVFGARIVHGAFTGRYDPLDLVIGKNGRISDEKIWTHVGKAMLVFAMLKDASDGHPDYMLQGALFIALAAHEVFIRWMQHRENPLAARTATPLQETPMPRGRQG